MPRAAMYGEGGEKIRVDPQWRLYSQFKVVLGIHASLNTL